MTSFPKLLFLLACLANGAMANEIFTAMHVPTSMEPGTIASVRLLMHEMPDKVFLKFGDKLRAFHLVNDPYAEFRDTQANLMEAWVATSVEEKADSVDMLILAATKSGKLQKIETNIYVTKKKFPVEHLTVSETYSSPKKEHLDQSERDREERQKALKNKSYYRLVDGPFEIPVNSKVTSPFGKRRTQNGKPRSRHLGVDLRAATGVEIKAAHDGIVLLSADHFYPGSVVYLDHGDGLVTAYFHLSERKVQNGEEIKKGRVIGLAGATGRVNAPHLHWSATLDGVAFDALSLLTLHE